MSTSPRIHPAWADDLAPIFASERMKLLSSFLRDRQNAGATIYPPMANIFAAMDMVAPDDVKVVILGQDPYHGPGQAHGLSFSVQDGVKPPPSLANMYKELVSDLGVPMPTTGNLTHWARQGVLLLNALLTVEEGKPLAHKKQGWEQFTDAVIARVNQSNKPTVFILWGAHAQKKGAGIDESKHLVLRSVHPSPLSATRGFFGSKPYSQANAFLESHGRGAIDWRLP